MFILVAVDLDLVVEVAAGPKIVGTGPDPVPETAEVGADLETVPETGLALGIAPSPERIQERDLGQGAVVEAGLVREKTMAKRSQPLIRMTAHLVPGLAPDPDLGLCLDLHRRTMMWRPLVVLLCAMRWTSDGWVLGQLKSGIMHNSGRNTHTHFIVYCFCLWL